LGTPVPNRSPLPPASTTATVRMTRTLLGRELRRARPPDVHTFRKQMTLHCKGAGD
jgi:hypothetical protein